MHIHALEFPAGDIFTGVIRPAASPSIEVDCDPSTGIGAPNWSRSSYLATYSFCSLSHVRR